MDLNTARAKAGTTTETKEVVDFADRLWYVLELKINKLRIAMQKSNIRGQEGRVRIVSARMV
jgi:hypothetical protein